MITFAMPGYEVQRASEGQSGSYAVHNLASGELWLDVQTDVQDQSCQIVGTIAPPDGRLLEITMLADSLRRQGAANVTAYLPYLAYSRQDKPAVHQSSGFLWAMQQLQASGISKVMTIDVHNPAAADQSPLPIHSLPMASIFAKHLETLPDDCLVVAPDAGAAQRAQALVGALGLAEPIVMSKSRTDQGVTHQPVVQALVEHVLVVDDILDTGETLLSCCRQLRHQGVTHFILVVTHGLFSGDRWQELWELGVDRLYVSDSVPGRQTMTGDHSVVVCATQM